MQFTAGIYLLKVNDRNTETRCEICSKLTIKTTERRRRRSGVFTVNFEHISHLILVFLPLTLRTQNCRLCYNPKHYLLKIFKKYIPSFLYFHMKVSSAFLRAHHSFVFLTLLLFLPFPVVCHEHRLVFLIHDHACVVIKRCLWK